LKQKEENKMLDQLQNMMASPQALDMVFNMIAQKVAQASPEVREVLSRVKVTLEKMERGIHLEVGRSDDARVEATVKEAIQNWTEMLSRGFQSMGFSVEIVE
jgi:hypothetical protein